MNTRQERTNTSDLNIQATERQQYLNQIDATAKLIKQAIQLETQGYIPKNHLSYEGCVALARVSVTDPNLFGVVKKDVMQQITDPINQEPLTPKLVNKIWITRQMEQEDKNKVPRSAKLFILFTLITSYDMADVHPAISHDELYNLLANRGLRNDGAINNPYIPFYDFSSAERYNEPPYQTLQAELLLMNPRDETIFNFIGHLTDKWWKDTIKIQDGKKMERCKSNMGNALS